MCEISQSEGVVTKLKAESTGQKLRETKGLLKTAIRQQIRASWEVFGEPEPLGIRRSRSGGMVRIIPMKAGVLDVKISAIHPATGVNAIAGTATAKYASPKSQP